MKEMIVNAIWYVIVFVCPILLVWLGRILAAQMKKIGDKLVEDIKAKSGSELVKKGMDVLYSLATPIVKAAFSTASKEILKNLEDRKITAGEATASLKLIGEQVKKDVRTATASWKEQMSPYIGDTDKIVEAVTEEIYEVIKKNFRLQNSVLAQPSAVVLPKSDSATK